MSKEKRCYQCEEYETLGHNYCRVCGFHLTKGKVQHVKLAAVYNTQERFCGYCGAPIDKCKC